MTTTQRRMVLLALLGVLLAAQLSRAEEAEDKAIAFVKKLGGSVVHEKNDPTLPVFLVSLVHTKVTDADLKELASFKNLRELELFDTQITDKGLKELAGHKRLQMLDLTKTKVSDVGLKELIAFKDLQELSLRKTQVTEAGIKELRKAFPKREIFH